MLGRWAARVAGVPNIVHTAHGHVFYGHFGPLVSRLFLIVEKLTALITDRMIALTRNEGDDYLRLGVCPPEKLAIVHSGVDWQQFAINASDKRSGREALGIVSEGPLIGFVGWLLPIKGPKHLLDAMTGVWAQWPDARLVFVGKGEQETELRQRVAKLDTGDKVHFWGWRDDIQAIMPLFDVFVLPSLNEGMGRVLVEAMAAVRPIVASRTGGIVDLIQDGQNGLLVPPGNAKALAEAITRVLANPDRASAMGEAGFKRCRKYSLGAMLSKLEGLYLRLLHSHVSGTRRQDGPERADLGRLNAILRNDGDNRFEFPQGKSK